MMEFQRRDSMVLWIVTLFAIIPMVLCGGKIEIRFLTYVNPGGEGANGHCCDGRSIFCFGACDHFFVLCLDNRNGQASTWTCPYGRIETGRIEDANTITFGGSIGGTKNPMIFSFDSWPGSMKLKVRVEDHDDNSNDFVDLLLTYLDDTPAMSSSVAVTKRTDINQRTRLALTTKVYCDPMYFGSDCTVFCQPKDDWTGHYTCNPKTGQKTCLSGWGGANCERSLDDCIGNECQNGATCLDGYMSYVCRCPPGFKGIRCEQDIDECLNQPCQNNGTCHNFDGGFNCTCPTQWKGSSCMEAVDFCEDNPCINSTCESVETGFLCTCNVGWTGTTCNENVDECQVQLCKNNATCFDTHGSYTCLCTAGFTGSNCEINIDECQISPCMNNGSCTDLIDGFSCACGGGFTGNLCQYDVDECALSPCKHSSACLNYQGGFNCICVKGTTGQLCEINLDECENMQCENGGTCEDNIGHFTCHCLQGFHGETCHDDINECLQNDTQCENGAKCLNTHGSFLCNCLQGFEGESCETEIDECQSNPCRNGGKCTDLVGGFSCACVEGFTGNTCESDIDECFSNPCINNATETVKDNLIDEQGSHETKIAHSQSLKGSRWADTHWYVIVGIVVAALVLLIIPIFIYIKKSRNKRRAVDMVQYWPTNDQLSVHGFDNAVYGITAGDVPLYGQTTTEYQPQQVYRTSTENGTPHIINGLPHMTSDEGQFS